MSRMSHVKFLDLFPLMYVACKLVVNLDLSVKSFFVLKYVSSCVVSMDRLPQRTS